MPISQNSGTTGGFGCSNDAGDGEGSHKSSGSPVSPKPCVSGWSVDEVCSWLANNTTLKLTETAVREQDVTGSLLLKLDDEDLAELGVTSRLQRKRLLTAIAQLVMAPPAGSRVQQEEDNVRSYLERLHLSETAIDKKIAKVKEDPSKFLENKACGGLAKAILGDITKAPAREPPKPAFRGDCNNCGKKGHRAADCSEPKSEFRVDHGASPAVETFDRILKDETGRISSFRDAKRFVDGLKEYAASHTVEMLFRMEKQSGCSRLTEALSFGTADACAYTTLTLAVLRLLDDERLQNPTYTTSTNSLYLAVYRTPKLLPAMIAHTKRADGTADLICSFAITVANLLPEARDDILLRELEKKLVTFRCKQVDRLSRLLGPSDTPGRISKTVEEPGGRHDNDHADYRRVALIPTPAELDAPSTRPPYLPLEADANRFLEDDEAHLLDKQFRLLREDLVNPLKRKLEEALRKPTDLLHSAQFVGAALLPSPCIRLRFQVPEKMSKTKDKSDFWDDSRLLQYGTVVGLFQDGENPLFGRVADRDSKRLAEDQTIGLMFNDQFLSKALSWIKDASKQNMLLFEISASFFSYEPILKRLQQMSYVPFADEIVHMKPSQPIKYADLTALQAALATEVEKLAFELDSSQRNAIDTALHDRVSLIQGPPGTGKSFIGELIAKVLLKATDEKILCVCYTNHALDQFLEALHNKGEQNLVRLGISSKNETVKKYELRSLTAKAQFDLETRKEWFLIKNEMERLEKTFTQFTGFMDMNDLIWRRADKYLQTNEPELHSQFAVPQSKPGYKVIGPGGKKELTQNDIWHRWKAGGEPYAGMEVGTLWKKSHSERTEMYRAWLAKIKQIEAEKCAHVMRQHQKLAKRKNDIRNLDELRVLKQARVIGCTTHGAASRKEMLQVAGAKVLIVEEAAEVLEAHVLTSICSSTEHVIMIGDHKQLRPKADCYKLRIEAGMGYGLNRSLFERMVDGGFKLSTLTQQHRMHPSISSLVRELTYPDLTNCQNVKDFPSLRGVSKRVFFIDHSEPETQPNCSISELASEQGKSKANRFEAQMCARMVKYLLQQGYKPSQLVVLATYKAQLKLLRECLKDCQFETVLGDLDLEELEMDGDSIGGSSHNSAQAVRVATVDNYQGEEADVVIASFVRSNKDGNVGHLSETRRINVLLSRARHGLIMIGSVSTMRDSVRKKGSSDPDKIPWNHLFRLLHTFLGFPAICSRHPKKGIRLLRKPNDFDAMCPDGGCAEACKFVLNCGHLCPKKCHAALDGQHNSNAFRCKELSKHKCVTCGYEALTQCWRVQASDFEACKGCKKLKELEIERVRDLARKHMDALEKAEFRPPHREEVVEKGSTLEEWNRITDRVENYMRAEHGYIKVIRIEKLLNGRLEHAWLKARTEMIDPANNPTQLFHGTSAEATDGIAEKGFLLPPKGERNMFGQGVYLATDSTKSANTLYTKGSNRLLICEALLGHTCTIEGWSTPFPLREYMKTSKTGSNKGKNFLDVDLDSVRQRGFDSVYAARDCREAGGVKYDEMIVYDPRLVLPKYIVHFQPGGNFDGRRLIAGQKYELKPKRVFEQNDPEDAHFRTAESQFRRMLESSDNRKSKITQIDYYVSPSLEKAFNETKRKYDGMYPAHETRLVFHGTRGESIDPIMENGFKLEKVGSATDPGWYGHGIYFSEKTAYSQNYDRAGGRLLLCQLLLGKPYFLQDDQRMDGQACKPGYTSHVVNDGDEIVMFDMAAILPTYVVHYV